MGMSFSPMYQPVTSSTIKADGDMDISPYDLLCTDVHADTVEATEFVGGVGNFESGLYSGGVDVSGILHAENTLQVDGNLMLEGALNNVNFGTNGDITTAGTVTASGGFEGVFNGNLLGYVFLAASVSGSRGDFVCATGEAVANLHMNTAPPSGVNYTVTPLVYPDTNEKVSNGIYRNPSYVKNKINTRTAKVSSSYSWTTYMYYKRPDEQEYHNISLGANSSKTFQLEAGEYMIYGSNYLDVSILADTVYATYDSP